MSKNNKYYSFQEARDYIRKLKLKSQSDWKRYCKSGERPPFIPVSPDKTYKKEGWISWSDWLDTNNKAPGDHEFLPFEDARNYARSLNFKGRNDWRKFSSNKPDNIPAAPERTYKGQGWINWGDWLGTGVISTHQIEYRSFEEAREFARSLNFKMRSEWGQYCKSGQKPKDIPMAANSVYKSKGWSSWADWLGVAREYLPFKDARQFAHSLQLKARGEWVNYCKSGVLPLDIPQSPGSTYKHLGWVNWADWLGTENVANFKKIFKSFEEARSYVRSLNLKTYDEWREYRKSGKKPKDIPGAPNTTYANEGWAGYADWLGIVNRWNKPAILAFVKSLLPVIDSLEPVELFSIMRRNGLIDATSNRNKNDELLKDVVSLAHLSDQAEALEKITDRIITSSKIESKIVNELIENEGHVDTKDEQLPELKIVDILKTLDATEELIFDPDESIIEFLINKAVSKLWKCFLQIENLNQALETILHYQGSKYSETVKEKFLHEYDGAKNITIPDGYSFRKNGAIQPPNLMQRLVAFRLKQEGSLGNWSGVGAGKTLSAILSSRVLNAKLTVVIALNNTIEGWRNEILSAYPKSRVYSKKYPHSIDGNNSSNYLILNYEAFQLKDSEKYIKWLVENHKIDFIIFDEIQSVKKRNKLTTKRRNLLEKLLYIARDKNPLMCTLGISATPVINDLEEAVSLLSLIKGKDFKELKTHPNLSNCVAVHEQLIINGVRYVPPYEIAIKEKIISIDGNALVEELKTVGKYEVLKLEHALVIAKLPAIKAHIQPGTIIYTHYVSGIVNDIKTYLTQVGYTFSEFTGNQKEGLNLFINKQVDVLIASSTVGTGLDGLQKVCNRLIILNLPWTHAGYQQLLGRIYRQGSLFEEINVIVPQVTLSFEGKEWSWDKQRMGRVLFKKTIGDAVLDGIIPEEKLKSPGSMLEDARNSLSQWINFLEKEPLFENV